MMDRYCLIPSPARTINMPPSNREKIREAIALTSPEKAISRTLNPGSGLSPAALRFHGRTWLRALLEDV